MKTQPLKPIAVVAGSRTPFIKSFTDFNNVHAVELGKAALLNAVFGSGVAIEAIDEVVFGNVSGPPDAANIARVIALEAGLPIDRIAHTVNRNCASGMESILSGWQAIEQGRAGVVVAGGTESMSKIPLLFNDRAVKAFQGLAGAKSLVQKLKAISAFRPGHFKPVTGIKLGLTDPVCGLNMGQTAEVLAKEFNISRSDQDRFAMESHRKAQAAQEACFLSGEIVPMEPRDGVRIEKDNAIRYGQSMEQLAKLKTIFERGGTVTAGNSCPLTDGAAALVLTGADDLERFQSPPLGYITAYAIAGCDPKRMGLGPVYATAKLLKQTGLTLEDFDLIEINEAFAAQVIACQIAMGSQSFAENELGRRLPVGQIDPQRLNVNGGAIALGHPVGTTGTRLVLTLLRALKAKGADGRRRRGLATLCVGGGQGMAMVVETQLEDRS